MATSRGTRAFRFCIGLVSTASLVVVAAAAPSSAAAGPAIATGRYAALGDSYTSSPLTGLPTGPNGIGCTRSDNNYPHVVQASLQAAAFADISCGGARTEHVFQPQTGPLGGTNDPQITAVTADTTVVTVGFGGNDIGFSSIIQDCVSLLPFGSPCRDRYTAGGVDQLAARIAATAPKIDAVLAAVRERAPAARIFVVGYPAVLPDSGGGCYPLMPITPTDVGYLRATEKRLNAMLADRAAAGGARYADVYTGSIGHDVCAPSGVRWIEGLVPAAPAAPVHPNALGSAGMAGLVLRAMLAAG
jgi:hypothetical protein